MNNASRKILKALFITSALSLLHSNQNEATASAISSDNEGSNDKNSIRPFKPKITKDVVKISSNGNVRYIAGHRSHSSHRSHYSSRSGSSHYSSSSTSSSSTRSSSFMSAPAAPKVYSLGERTISQGMSGADVANLADLLVKNLYLNKADVTQINGKTIYNAKIRSAIVQFQKDANLTATGNTDANTVERLKAWDSSKSTVILGVRDLTVGVSGADVAELIKLLTKAGYAPDSSKLETVNGVPKMTEDILMAVKLFQAYNKLAVTGNIDSATLAKLKALGK